RGGGDGDATLLLLLHPVHGRSTVVNLAHLVAYASVEKDALGRRRFAGVDVRRDANVAIALNGSLASHDNPPSVFMRPRARENPAVQSNRALAGPDSPPSRKLRNGSARMPCLLRPCGALPRDASSRNRGLRQPRAVRRPDAAPS